jgi:hypothetical protein
MLKKGKCLLGLQAFALFFKYYYLFYIFNFL